MNVSTMLVTAALLAATTLPSSAQPAVAQAEHLFREGKRLMREGNIAAACEAFEGSYAKDPAVSTLLNLADCREKNQQYASAWAYFVEAARTAGTGAEAELLRKTAQDRAAKLEPRLSYLIINVPDEAKVEGLTVTRNGIPVDQVEWNRDIPVDGGEYLIEGKAPAYEPWSTKVTIEVAKDKQSVNVPRFREVRPPALPHEQPRQDDRLEREASTFTSKRKAAIALWAIGAVGVGGAVALEIKSGSTYDEAKTSTDNVERRELTDTANLERRSAMIAGAVGAVAIGVGVYLWMSGEPEARTGVALVPRVDHQHAGLVLVGGW